MSKDGTIIVEAEFFSELVVEIPQHHADTLQQLIPSADGVIEYAANLDPYRTRKRWILNGAHLLIALHALENNASHLDRFLSDVEHAPATLAGIVADLGKVYVALDESGLFSPGQVQTYCQSVQERFKSAPDQVARILHRFTGADNLEDFIKNLFDKVTKQALKAMTEKQENLSSISIANSTLQLLVSENRYAPKPRIYNVPLD